MTALAEIDRRLKMLDIIESLMRHGWSFPAAIAAAPTIAMLTPKEDGTLEIVYADGATESPTTLVRPPESARDITEVSQLSVVSRKKVA